MRAVIDTNVLMAALLWRGPPHALLEHVRAGTVSLVSSPALLAELAEVIVSGDGDLLSLGSFAGIPIIAPAQAVGLIEATGKA